MIIKNAAGREFFIRVVMMGDKHGRNDCLTHDELMPLIEFYDYTYAEQKSFGPRGQFVSSYNADTLAETDAGLALNCGVSEWSVDAAAMQPVRALAVRLAAQYPDSGAARERATLARLQARNAKYGRGR